MDCDPASQRPSIWTGQLAAPANPTREWLKARDYTLNLEERAGRTQVANMGLPAAQQAGSVGHAGRHGEQQALGALIYILVMI